MRSVVARLGGVRPPIVQGVQIGRMATAHVPRANLAGQAKKASTKGTSESVAQTASKGTPKPAAASGPATASEPATPPSRLVQFSNLHPADKPLPRLVILGGGWGSTFLLKNLKPYIYNTTLVSRENFFLFTPLLAEATTGTLEPQCTVEGSRQICIPSGSYFVEAQVTDVDFDNKVVKAVSLDGENIDVPYDFLVISVGATVNTFGIPGIAEHAVTLKTIGDSIKIRKKIMENFEKAEVASSDKDKKQLLTFVVCGAGPTGVECIAELHDLIYGDLSRYFPALVEKYVSLKLIEGADRVLLALGKDTSSKCYDHIKNIGIDVHLNTLVSEMDSNYVKCKTKDPETSQISSIEIPYGLCIWSGGVGPSPLTKKLCEKLYPGKKSRGFVVENNLRLKNHDGVFAIGDCATFAGPSLEDVFHKALGESATTAVTYSTFSSAFKKACKELPYKSVPSSKVKMHFEQFDADKSDKLEQGELHSFYKAMNMKYTTLAPTAQVASQQGEFLGSELSKLFPDHSTVGTWTIDSKSISPFKYDHAGVFAYLGNGKSVLELDNGTHFIGRISFFIWKIAYLSKQVSYRNSYAVLTGWLKR